MGDSKAQSGDTLNISTLREIIDEVGAAYAIYTGIPKEQKWLRKAQKKATDQILTLLANTIEEAMPEKLPTSPKYDGDNLDAASDTYGCAFRNWGEVIRYEDGYNAAHYDMKAKLRGLL